MIEHLVDLDDHDDGRAVSAHEHLVEVRGVGAEPRPPVDPQRVAAAGDERQQADVWVGEDVVEAVGSAVTGPVGDRDRAIVEDAHEPGRVALRRDVEVAHGVGSRQHAER